MKHDQRLRACELMQPNVNRMQHILDSSTCQLRSRPCPLQLFSKLDEQPSFESRSCARKAHRLNS